MIDNIEDNNQEQAVVTVLGSDKVGIVAEVTDILAQHNVNIIDISQTLLEDLFAMIMLVELDDLDTDFETLSEQLEAEGEELGVKIMLQHEQVFRYMHRI
ncbi:ACT domain-containing protein [Halanaerobaculum tunisiense]